MKQLPHFCCMFGRHNLLQMECEIGLYFTLLSRGFKKAQKKRRKSVLSTCPHASLSPQYLEYACLL